MMDLRTIGLRGAALAAALALAGCGKDGDAAEAKDKEAAAAVAVGPEAIQVAQVEELRTGPALSGNLKAEREAQVRAQMGGTVLSVTADKGQPVRAGQVLARIDDLALRDQMTSAQSGVRSAQNALEVARRNHERSQTLAAAGAIAERDLELARNQLSQAQAALADARARASTAREQLGNSTVTAPISGIVSERPVSAGDVVQPGGALFTIVDPGSMQLEASVPASVLGQLRIGAPVRFTVSGYPGRVFTGTVRRINPAADASTGQVPVVVTIPNSEGTLVSGLFAEGRVEAEARRAILVPANAVDERGVQPTVLRLKAGVAERVPVTLGARDSETDRVEIVSGVAAGDTLLVGGALGTTPGTRVTVRGGAAPAPAAP